MHQTGKQTAAILLFLSLLIGPLLYQRFTGNQSSGAGTDGTQASASADDRYGFHLQNMAAEAGIQFQHSPPRIDKKLAHIEPQIASMGASVSIVDFDRDGWNDFYVTNSSPGSLNALYKNLRTGEFRDVSDEVGLAALNQPGTGACMGSVWADYDNDGYEDVLIYKWGQPELFHNEGGKSFTNVTQSSGLPDWCNAGSATWLDFDNDGDVDLLITGYWPDQVRLESLNTTRIMPESFEYAGNGGRNWLLKNDGQGVFEDVTQACGLSSTMWTLAVIAADFNKDGLPDLFFANDYGASELYLNGGPSQSFRFLDASKESGIGKTPKSGMNAAVGDVLNQGRLAIYETNISEEGVLLQGNNLWYPLKQGTPRFENMASVMGIEIGGWSFGAQFGDLNNDGYLDLYLTNGYVSGDPATTYWYDFSEITGGHSSIISDAENWPDMKGRSLAGHQQKKVWMNDGNGRFIEVGQGVGVDDTFDGRAVAIGDFRNNGTLDVLVANQGGPLLYYQNTVHPDHHWIEFEFTGTASNRSAIGLQATLTWDGQQQLQEVVSATGYSAQNQRRLHFGLGDSKRVEHIEIRWPSGELQIIESPDVDQLHQVREPQ